MKKNIATELINAGREQARISVETINPPIHRASTVLFGSYADMLQANRGEFKGIAYGTEGLAAQRAFEETMRELEGAEDCIAFQSGINAIAMSLMAFTEAGDHVLVCDNVYGPTRNFCNRVLSKYGVETEYFPSTCGTDIGKWIKDNTKVVFVESPGSNTFEIQDIPAIVNACEGRDIVTMMDNTWATPLYFSPLEHGVDVSIHSVSKYISGHSDILLGTAAANSRCWERLREFCGTLELFAPQEDCYQALRGLRTLPVRLRQHEQAALQIARGLQELECVAEVIHPALETHPEHALWKRDFNGSSGLFAFVLDEKYEESDHAPFMDSLELFGMGYSWGGFKSLITGGRFKRSNSFRYEGRTIFRVNVGMEDSADLLDDLKQGLSKI